MRMLMRKAKRGFTLIELMIVVAIIGVLAVLGIYGVRKYIANAKSAEARANVGQISKNAAAAFNRESMAGGVLSQGTSSAILQSLCLTGNPVPATITSVTAKKYQSAPSDWNTDSTASVPTGWPCLKFVLDSPQYYMYTYASSATAAETTTAGTTFTATANGDLDGNTTQSTFQMSGLVTGGVLNVSPIITETLPEE